MKKILLLCIIMSFSVASLSQSLNPCHLSTFLSGNGWNWDTIICRNDQGVITERMTQNFDQHNYVVSQLFEKPVISGWQNYIRNLCNRDLAGNLTNMITEQWSGTDWITTSRITVSYNSSFKITMELVEIWDNGSWKNLVQRNYTYNGAGLKTRMLQEKWQNSAWQNDLMSDFTYDGNGNLYTVIASYTESGGPWIIGARYTYTCDFNGNYIETLVESWDIGSWIIEGKIIYTNSSQGDILSEMFQVWQDGTWVPESRKIYTYDIYGNVLSGITEQYSSGSWLPEIATSYLYYKKEYIQVINIPVYSYVASYRSVLSVADHSSNNHNFSVHPNPVSGHFSIDAPMITSGIKFRIFDQTGKMVKNACGISTGEEISTTGLQEGPCILEIIWGGITEIHKIIILKN